MSKPDLAAFWEEHNSKINTIIGKLTAAKFRGNLLVDEAHQNLIDFAIWFDEQMEHINEPTK